MEQQIHITLQFHLATGKVNLNEIVYRLQKLQSPLMLRILEQILRSEVVYNSLLLKKRKEVHEKIGKSIIDLHSNRLKEFYEVLSYHYSRSNDLENALQYLRLSGDKAIRKQSYR